MNEPLQPIPLLTAQTLARLQAAASKGPCDVSCTLDLGRTTTTVVVDDNGWTWGAHRYPHVAKAKDRTIYYWDGANFAPAQRFDGGLIKLIPTEWGPPTFEIDGIKMLPTAKISPYEDAKRKVALIEPLGKTVLDTCGGLGYFAAWCLDGGAARILSFEKSPTVAWLRQLNPWSPRDADRLTLRMGDVTREIATIADQSIDAALHDPPRFGIAGELYSGLFYGHLARVLKRRGRLFHYTGTPNKLTTGRDVQREVAKRLQAVGFVTRIEGDGVLATKAG